MVCNPRIPTLARTPHPWPRPIIMHLYPVSDILLVWRSPGLIGLPPFMGSQIGETLQGDRSGIHR
jgi:hypothetical protein